MIGWVVIPMQREYERIQDAVLLEPSPIVAVEDEVEISEVATEAPVTPALSPAVAGRLERLVVGEWRLDQLQTAAGELVNLRTPDAFSLVFMASGQVSGRTDCNNFSGRFVLTEDEGISMGPFAMTRMACPDTQEQVFIDAVTQATQQTFLPDGQLQLSSATGERLRLAPPVNPVTPTAEPASSTDVDVEEAIDESDGVFESATTE